MMLSRAQYCAPSGARLFQDYSDPRISECTQNFPLLLLVQIADSSSWDHFGGEVLRAGT